jgi:predicted enzyme related to lactoylglutathione lyase
MTTSENPTRITHVVTIPIPVTDHERALAFYAGVLGFETRADFTYGDGERWTEVAPPGGQTTLALTSPRDGTGAGVETRVTLVTDDVEADHAALRRAGADADPAILREGDPPVVWSGILLAGMPPMFLVRDPDGNSLLIVQHV